MSVGQDSKTHFLFRKKPWSLGSLRRLKDSKDSKRSSTRGAEPVAGLGVRASASATSPLRAWKSARGHCVRVWIGGELLGGLQAECSLGRQSRSMPLDAARARKQTMVARGRCQGSWVPSYSNGRGQSFCLNQECDYAENGEVALCSASWTWMKITVRPILPILHSCCICRAHHKYRGGFRCGSRI